MISFIKSFLNTSDEKTWRAFDLNSFSFIPCWSGLYHLEEKKKSACCGAVQICDCLHSTTAREENRAHASRSAILSDYSFNPGAKLPKLVIFKMILVCTHNL